MSAQQTHGVMCVGRSADNFTRDRRRRPCARVCVFIYQCERYPTKCYTQIMKSGVCDLYEASTQPSYIHINALHRPTYIIQPTASAFSTSNQPITLRTSALEKFKFSWGAIQTDFGTCIGSLTDVINCTLSVSIHMCFVYRRVTLKCQNMSPCYLTLATPYTKAIFCVTFRQIS